MGADIHVFLEEVLEDYQVCNLDKFYSNKDGELVRIGSYEGRSPILFDILQKDVPQNGFPTRYSKTFENEWKFYKTCRYGINHISFYDLYSYWVVEQKKTFKKLDSVDEFNKSIVLFPFINEIYKSMVDLDPAYWGYKTSRWNFLNVIYFFDR